MKDFFSHLARAISEAVGHPLAFGLAVFLVLAWGCLGPMMEYSETWQLIINTSTTIMTFLMLFLVQNSQNRDSRSMQIKLDELLRVTHGARNDLIDLEDMTEKEIERYFNEFKRVQAAYGEALEKKRRHHHSPTQASTKPRAKRRH